MAKWLSWLTGQPTPDTPVAFGYKVVWFAVRATDTARVAAALGLQQPAPCNWKSGIKGAYEETGIFITPPVDGWILALGFPLAVDEAGVAARLETLSREFGEAQYFGTHRVSEYHAWARAVYGKIVRHYAYVGDQGETLRNDGEPTPAEPANLFDTVAGEAAEDADYPDEEAVMQVADAWSVDPTSLEERTDLAPALGLLAR